VPESVGLAFPPQSSGSASWAEPAINPLAAGEGMESDLIIGWEYGSGPNHRKFQSVDGARAFAHSPHYFVTSMPSFFHNLLFFLTVLSVGAMQVWGVPAGYRCPCTGDRLVQAECGTAVCHPDDTHADGCRGDLHDGPETQGGGDSKSPARDGHPHSEVRESPEMTGSFPAVSLPAVMFVELSPAFQGPDPRVMVAGDEGPELPPDGSAPTPLLVARTMVMLV